LVLTSLVGCQPSSQTSSEATATAGHDHDDHAHGHAEHGHEQPETLDAGVKQVTTMSTTILDAFAAGKPNDAHGELHEIGHSIECLQELANAASLGDEAKQTVKDSVDALMEAVGTLDETLHGGSEAKIEDVKMKVDEALQALTAVAGQSE
jgi:hypothetical protein